MTIMNDNITAIFSFDELKECLSVENNLENVKITNITWNRNIV